LGLGGNFNASAGCAEVTAAAADSIHTGIQEYGLEKILTLTTF